MGLINGNGDAIDASWPNGDSPPARTCWRARLPIASVGKLGQIQPSASLQGMVTSYDASGNVSSGMGPGNVSGEGYGPPPAAIGEGSLLGSAL
jgi:hypothetical protein